MFKLAIVSLLLLSLSAYSADKELDKLLSKQKYQQASEYIEKKYPAEQRNGELWVKAGLICENLKMKEKALSCYLAAYKMNNNDPKALLSLGRLYNDLGFTSNAYVMLHIIIANHEEGRDALWEISKSCMSLGKLDEAKKYLIQLQGEPEAQKALGLILFDQKNYSEAVPALVSFFNKKKDIDVARKLVGYFIATKKVQEGLECFRFVVATDKDPSATINLARYYISVSDFEEAIKLYVMAPENKYEAIDFYNIALYKKAGGRPDEALQFFSRAAELSPESTDLWRNANVNMGQIYLDMKDYKGALQSLKIAGDKIKESNLHLARCYDALKDYKNSGIYAAAYFKQNPSSISAHMILIASYEKLGYLTKAKELREKVLALDPKNSATQAELGDYYYMGGQFAQALKYFEKSFLLEQNSSCLEKIAECAYRTNQPDKVRDACESILKTDPSHIKSLDLLYRVYISEKKYPQAEKRLETLVQLVSTNLDYFLQLSICYEALGQTDKLPALDEKIVDLSPTNEKSKRRLAEYRFKTGKLEDALNLYTDIIRMGVVKVTDYPNIIQITVSLNLKPKAIEYLNQYVKLQPDNSDLYKKLGDLYYDQKMYDEALSSYKTALSKNSDMIGVYANYSKLVVMKKWEIKYVLKISERAVELGEADFEVFYNLGEAYYSIGSFEKALVTYEKAARLNPKDLPAFSKLADCQIRTGKNDAAIVSYEQLVILDIKNKNNFRILGDLYLKKDKKKEAVGNYKKYLEGYTDDELATMIALFEYEQKNPKEALKYFERMTSSSQQTQFAKAECYLAVNNYKTAAACFGVFIEKYPESTKFYLANKLLAIAFDSLKDSLDAISHYQVFLQKENDADIAFRVGTLQEPKNAEGARQTYAANTVKYPTDFRNFAQLGLLTEKNPKKALAYFQKAVALKDTLLWVWLKIGGLCDSLQDEEGKITAYKKAINIDPQNYDANKYLGITLFNKGLPDEGLLYLELARSHNANDPEIMYTLGKSYALKGNTVEAILLFKTAKKLQPNNQPIRFSLVRHLVVQGQLEEALKEITELLALKDSKESFNLYIDVLFKMKKYSTIESVIKERRKQYPDSIDLLMTLAKARVQNLKFEDAIEAYKMVSYIKDYAPGYVGRADVYVKLQRIDDAKMYYEKALKIDPKSVPAELGLATVYKFSGKKDLYFEHLKKAQQLDPNNPEVRAELNQVQTLK